jgi:hypothetical protein
VVQVITRYHIDTFDEGSVEPRPDGDWVKFDDIAPLIAQAREALECALGQVPDFDSEAAEKCRRAIVDLKGNAK